jgi:hypothetical protein
MLLHLSRQRVLTLSSSKYEIWLNERPDTRVTYVSGPDRKHKVGPLGFEPRTYGL